MRRKRNEHVPPVFRVLFLANQPVPHGPANKLNDGVMTLLHKFGQFRDGGAVVFIEPRNAQHQLMLLGRYAVASGRALAESQEFAQTVPKSREVLHHLKRVAVSGAPCVFAADPLHRPIIS